MPTEYSLNVLRVCVCAVLMCSMKKSALGVLEHRSRVTKCQGFWGLIPVKMFAGWGKNVWKNMHFSKLSLVVKIYASFSSFPCKNWPNVIKFSIFVLQNHIFSKLSLLKTPKLLRIAHFSWGK